MLAGFKVANFLSFKELQEFSMVAGNLDSHPDHIYNEGVKLLDRAIMYGPNSSGKSNFVNAIAYARWIALGGNNDESVANMKIFENMGFNDGKESSEGSYFEFNIVIKNKMYSYGFEFDTKLRLFYSEWLCELSADNTERTIFSFTFRKDDDNEAMYPADYDKEKNHRADSPSFLSQLYGGEPGHIRGWLEESLIVITTVERGIRFETTRNDFLRIVDELKRLDTGISGTVFAPEVENDATDKEYRRKITYRTASDISAGNVPHTIPENVVVWLYKDSISMELPIKKERSKKVEKTGTTEIVPLSFTHLPSQYILDFKDESEGTRRILKFLLLFSEIPKRPFSTDQRTIVYDEFECRIHA